MLWTNAQALEYTHEFYETVLPTLYDAYDELRVIDANGSPADVRKAFLETV
jgi:hypothetical protein